MYDVLKYFYSLKEKAHITIISQKKLLDFLDAAHAEKYIKLNQGELSLNKKPGALYFTYLFISMFDLISYHRVNYVYKWIMAFFTWIKKEIWYGEDVS